MIENWILSQQIGSNSPRDEELFAAEKEFSHLAHYHPRECWEIVLEVLAQTDDEWVITNLGAGPLEDLLALHPNEVIVWVETEAKNNPKLRRLLTDVWQNLMPDEVWERVQALRQ